MKSELINVTRNLKLLPPNHLDKVSRNFPSFYVRCPYFPKDSIQPSPFPSDATLSPSCTA